MKQNEQPILAQAAHGVSQVESVALAASGYALSYPPRERIGGLVVDTFPALGRLAALRFLEWVQTHPEGVIALPTGKTPEHFIKHVQRYLLHWNSPAVRRELEAGGLDPVLKPEMRGLHFVQIDEFYPISPLQHNSFHYYVQKFYLRGFQLDPQRALLIDPSRIGLREGENLNDVFPTGTVDLTLRTRRPKDALETRQQQILAEVDQFCTAYEARIHALGGIGFFLGGIGPDGHIGFNIRGSDHYSTTRLMQTNYETQAAAAADLGGIEISGTKHVITIGLQTITGNPEAVAIIIVAGEAKAEVVRDAVEQAPNNRYPATCLQALPNARFYLTYGAAGRLAERRLVLLSRQAPIPDQLADQLLMERCLSAGKQLDQLADGDAAEDRFLQVLTAQTQRPVPELAGVCRQRLVARLTAGLEVPSGETFLHTAPHHDDIMLGYLPFLTNLLRDPTNSHTFTYMTSGFTAVTNVYTAGIVSLVLRHMRTPEFTRLRERGYFDPNNRAAGIADASLFLDGLAHRYSAMVAEAAARRFLRNCVLTFEEDNFENLFHRLSELHSYLKTQYPGKKDLPYIQRLKGMLREWEAECLWAYYGFTGDAVRHLRLGFYQGDIFTEDPTLERDVTPIVELLNQVRPTTLTVALDPESSGPDTHYKVLQAIAAALRSYLEDPAAPPLRILGYRNVWFRFHPAEANLMVPIALSKEVDLAYAFVNCFASQRDASFPSYEHDGPFSELAGQIQVKQYEYLQQLLGREFFDLHADSRLRAARACVFLCELTPEQFFERSAQLRLRAENR